MRRRTISLAVLALVLCTGTGCAGFGATHWHLWAPATWPVFSGESKVEKARKADAAAGAAHANQAVQDGVSVHLAHVEIRKAQLALLDLSSSDPRVLLARRTLANGLGLLGQVDPLSAIEDQHARDLVADLLSASAGQIAAAERKQRDAEDALKAQSRRSSEADARAAKAELAARTANGKAQVAAISNIAEANTFRAMKAAIAILAFLLLVVSALAAYARFALGGVGAALHAAGAPAQVVSALDSELSGIGQWMVRHGRIAAAKAEAAAAAKLQAMRGAAAPAATTPATTL